MIKTKRDIELLNFLADYGMLSTKQIANLFFTGVEIRTVLRRLRILEENKLIRRAGKLETNNEHLWLVTETNGRTEGYNRKAKLIQRCAYGFRSFKNYRLKLLYSCR